MLSSAKNVHLHQVGLCEVYFILKIVFLFPNQSEIIYHDIVKIKYSWIKAYLSFFKDLFIFCMYIRMLSLYLLIQIIIKDLCSNLKLVDLLMLLIV